MKTTTIKIRGTRPILLHADTACDPLSEAAITMKRMTKRKDKATEEAQSDIARAEWLAGVYSDEDGIYLPTWNLIRSFQDAARLSKAGKLIERGVTAVSDRAHFIGLPKKIDKLVSDPTYRDRRAVKVGTARVIRTRPRIPTGWRIDVDLAYVDTMIDADSIREFAITAGALIGVGDFRQRFGRFEVL